MKYGLAAVLLVYLPYLGFVLGATTLSLILNFLGKEHRDARLLRFSGEMIGSSAFDTVVFFAAALIPFPLISFLCQSMLPAPGPLPWIYWGITFAALLSGCVLLSMRRSASLRSSELPAAASRAGAAGLLFFFAGAFLLFVLLGTLIQPEKLPIIRKYPVFLLSWNSLAAFLLFLALSFGLTGGVVHFLLGRAPAGKEEEDPGYRDYVGSTGSSLALGGALAVPVFVVLGLLSLPSTGLSREVFAASAAVVFLAMAVALALSLLPEKHAGKPGPWIPALYVLMNLAVVIGNDTAMGNAFLAWPLPVKPASVAKVPEEPLPEIPPAAEPGMEKGRVVFGKVCRACHLFETRIVGPPMKEVLPKYGGDAERLKRFIREPVKVNPGYPPMPMLGLNEEDVDAVALYLLGSIGVKPPAKAHAPPATAAVEKGKAVFDSICKGCHRFDARVVGPPLNEVVPKYKGSIEDLKGFIRNPVKKSPGYPSMPKLGLKEEEIDAVARYLLMEVEKGN
ncbi:MAG: c-type cytochrome [Deltaproteobacteria bacterium]